MICIREKENHKRKLLGQLDNIWEQHRKAELGSEAIMGPKPSPQKRVDTMAPQGANKQRRKCLKYPMSQPLISRYFPPDSAPVRSGINGLGSTSSDLPTGGSPC